MQNVAKPFLLLGLVAVLAIVALLARARVASVQTDTKTLATAAGDIHDESVDLTNPTPLVHCYPVSGPGDLDVRTRMDFEARTSAGWVPTPDHDDPGQFCLQETPQAVEKRLSEHRAE